MKGTLKGCMASWGSGIATLVIEDEAGKTHNVPGDNGPMFRSLSTFIPDLIAPGHQINMKALLDVEVEFETDDLGLLLWIGPGLNS